MAEPKEILKRYWGYNEFRPLQEDIIRSALAGNETIALLPTGGGKSICFQVPGLMIEGVCLVVSPLIALMKDQVQQLSKRNIKAAALYSGMSKKEIDITLDNCIYGDYKFLYVSPERLKSEIFLERAEKMKIGLLAIDEAHCISQWGYDFRPPYLEIAHFREEFKIEKIIALTATATREVKHDIADKLGMKDPKFFQKSFARFNLSYSVFNLENKLEKALKILTNVPGSSVIYVRSRKRTKEIADQLIKNGISASFYHAGLTSVERNTRQEMWIHGQVRVMVSTNAFGMGIDKPDVRTVIHFDLPDTLEAYYQEAGRAGRDEKKAYAIVLFHDSDIDDLKRKVEASHIDLKLIKRVYQSLANYYKLAVGSGENTSHEFYYEKFVQTFNLPVVETFYALKKLEDEGLILLTEGFYQPSKVIILVSHEDLYKFQVANQPMDPIIKTLLRLYGGELYTEYITIKESEIAQLLKINRKEVHQKLERLMQYDIIDYIPTSTAPHLTFVTPRLDSERLPIDKEMIQWRKKVASEKADNVANYLQANNMCRTRMLQEYFDERTEENCGICDYCVGRKRSADPPSKSEALKLIHKEGVSIDSLTIKLGTTRELCLEVIRELLDQGKVRIEHESEKVFLV